MKGQDRFSGHPISISAEHSLVHDGKMFTFSEYDSDVDIASPKQVSITVGSKPLHVTFSVSSAAPINISLKETVVIGTGGSASAGTSVTGRNRNRGSTNTLLSTVNKDYVLGSSGQSAGTEIDADYIYGATQGALKVGGASRPGIEWILKANTMYGLIITAIADNTAISWSIDAYEL